MMTVSERIRLNRLAVDHSRHAKEAWTRLGDTPDAKAAAASLMAFVRFAQTNLADLERQQSERAAMLDRDPVLQADLHWNGLMRKIVVAKPNDRIEEPFIPESFYLAIREKWAMGADDELLTSAPYDIAVIDRRGRTIAHIVHGNMI